MAYGYYSLPMRSDGTNTAKAAVFEIERSGVVKEDPIKMHDYTFTEVSQEEMCYAAAEFTYFSAQEEVLIHFNPMEKSNPNMQLHRTETFSVSGNLVDGVQLARPSPD